MSDLNGAGLTGAPAAVLHGGLESDILVCGICIQQFTAVVPFIKHKAEHANNHAIYCCELCEKTFVSHTVLLYHYRIKHKMQAFGSDESLCAWKLQCILSNPPPSKSNLKSPPQNLAQIYDHTDFNFILRTEIIKGNSFDYGKTVLGCLYCAHKCHSKNGLVDHMRTVHAEVDLTQDVEVTLGGDEKILSISAFESHMEPNCTVMKMGQHKSKLVVPCCTIQKEDPNMTTSCIVCKKVFSRRRSLQLHMDVHRTEKNFLCDTCGKTFKSRARLSIHRKTHREKVYKCSQCNFQSNVSAVVHLHRQAHSEGSVQCEICGYAYIDRSTLNKHMRVHSKDRPYACTYEGCTWRFKTEMMYRAHIKSHTTQGRFKCSFCGYVFRHKHHLLRHKAKMHGIERSKTCDPQKWAEHQKSRWNITGAAVEDCTSQVEEQDLSVEIPPSIPISHKLCPIEVAPDTGSGLSYETSEFSSIGGSYPAFLPGIAQDIAVPFTITDD
ncbi:zinc finger protein 182-like isoform X2 [Heptranchias perlo]|uniref:zinc finger protein 182-like isoform X2 n=1 Tax=Heptranchias perlo TaxID=212740 RepID=UPI003559663D